AELDHPLGGLVCRLEALGGVAVDVALGVHLGEIARHGATERNLGGGIRIGGGIAGIGCCAMRQTALEGSTLLGLGSDACLAQNCRRKCGGNAECCGAAHELAPRDPTLLDLLGPIFQFGHFVPPVHMANAWKPVCKRRICRGKPPTTLALPRRASTHTSIVPAE